VGLVARPEVRDLAKHITDLARDRAALATLKDQSRARAGAFRWPAVIDQLESIYEGIVA
jgi:glycosyltransferase involved in cell wall biosynthesis